MQRGTKGKSVGWLQVSSTTRDFGVFRSGRFKRPGANHCRSFTNCCGTTCVQVDEATWKVVLEAHPFLGKIVTHLSEALDLFVTLPRRSAGPSTDARMGSHAAGARLGRRASRRAPGHVTVRRSIAAPARVTRTRHLHARARVTRASLAPPGSPPCLVAARGRARTRRRGSHAAGARLGERASRRMPRHVTVHHSIAAPARVTRARHSRARACATRASLTRHSRLPDRHLASSRRGAEHGRDEGGSHATGARLGGRASRRAPRYVTVRRSIAAPARATRARQSRARARASFERP